MVKHICKLFCDLSSHKKEMKSRCLIWTVLREVQEDISTHILHLIAPFCLKRVCTYNVLVFGAFNLNISFLCSLDVRNGV
jgi:hypothetical protein